ncbi:MAG: ATP-dependent protease subunit HslV [Planctomycetota bacterium]
MSMTEKFHGTTILAVRRNGQVALGGDGQVTLGHSIVKGDALKIRKLHQNRVLVGFAGSVADSFALLERFEQKLAAHSGQLLKAASELSRDWRTDRVLRRLESMLAVCDRDHVLLLSGNGEVIQPSDGIVGIGSGGSFALAAARALIAETALAPREIVQRSLRVAADICIYTNHEIHVEVLE